MALNHRVKRLEKATGVNSVCPVCKGHWRFCGVVVYDDEQPDFSDKACPSCGELSSMDIVRVRTGERGPDWKPINATG